MNSPRIVYRMFPSEAHADALASGKVWITTLAVCRASESSGRGDPDEAHHIHLVTEAKGNMDDPQVRAVAERTRLFAPGVTGRNVSLSNIMLFGNLPDAYVLCMTAHPPQARLLDEFGKYVVAIRRPATFVRRVTRALEAKIELNIGAFGPVTYAPSISFEAEQARAPLGFVKDPSFAYQHEFRGLWQVEGLSPIAPFEIDVIDIEHLCQRIA